MFQRLHPGHSFFLSLALIFSAAFPSPAAAREDVLTGIDVLKREKFQRLKGLKIGLITNHTGHDRERDSTIRLLKNAPGVELKVLFSPEHGIDGTSDVRVENGLHSETGVPIVSLYGATPKRVPGMSDADYDAAALQSRQPQLDHLKHLDALVYDIQDGGARFYTRVAILGGAIEAAGKAGIRIFILDRPNPIGGSIVEGPVQTRHFSFVGYHRLPIRHGMTVGELAKMFNEERAFKADLHIVPVQNWERGAFLDETGLPWTRLSPGLRSLEAVMLYPGLCLLEATPVSVGRGTEFSFQVIGAPYIKDVQFARELNRAQLPGVTFVPVQFTPEAKHYVGPAEQLPFHGTQCGGVQIFITDRNQCAMIDVGITMVQVLNRLYPDDFRVDRMSKLLGHEETLTAIKAGKSLAEIKSLWKPALTEFIERRKRFLLYD